MHDILILSEGGLPGDLAKPGRWPGIRVRIEAGLSHGDISARLRDTKPPAAVIVTATSPLTDALAGLACPSVEVAATNPNRHTDGTPDFTAKPLGADAIICGLGDAGYATALTLLTDRLSGANP